MRIHQTKSFRALLVLFWALCISPVACSDDDTPQDSGPTADQALPDQGPTSDGGVADTSVDQGTPAGEAVLGNADWAHLLGGSDSDRGFAVTVDPQGNSYVTGYFSGSVDFGAGAQTSAGDYDIFLASYDPQGSLRWVKTFGGSGADYGNDLAFVGGSVYLTGAFRDTVDFGGGARSSNGMWDIYLASFSTDGTYRWDQTFGADSFDFAFGVSGRGDNIYVAGQYGSSMTVGGATLTSAGEDDAFVVSFDTAGAFRWAKSFGGEFYDLGQDVTVTPAGQVVVTGIFDEDVDFGGGILKGTLDDIFVVALTEAGEFVWAKRYGGGDADWPYAVIADQDSNLYLSGLFSGSVDFGGGQLDSGGDVSGFVLALDAGGAHRWSKVIGQTGENETKGLAIDGAGNLLVTGYFQGTFSFGGDPLASAGDADAFLASYTSDGVYNFALAIGGAGKDWGIGVAATQDGKALVSGYATDAPNVAIPPLSQAHGMDDLFVVHFD